MRRIIHALIDAHALRRIHLVAHSMGGSACLLLPDRVLARLASFVLIEPRVFLSSCQVASVAVGVTYEEFTATVFPEIHRQLSRDPRMAYDLGRADIRAFYNSSQSLIDWTSRRELLERYQLADCRKYFVYGAENRHLQELSFIRPRLRSKQPRILSCMTIRTVSTPAWPAYWMTAERPVSAVRLFGVCWTERQARTITMMIQPADQSPELTSLERAVLETALSAGGIDPELRRQVAEASVVGRTPSGVGFMTKLSVPENQRSADAAPAIPVVVARHPDLPSGAEFVLQIKNGRLSSIEAFCHEGMWPAERRRAFLLDCGP